MLEWESTAILSDALQVLNQGFESLPAFDPEIDREALRQTLSGVAARLKDIFPFPHPLYAGQMLKPPHPIARLAYSLALHLNPNNHALDGGRASSAMEKEAVAEIARMFGWDTYLGHLCGGGTMANLEALWVARELVPEMGIAASAQAHYSHRRLCGVLGVPFHEVPVDPHARMDIQQLERLVQHKEVGTVVATLGTTATGSVDPLPEILRLSGKYGFRIHVDAAYGGYFTLASNLEPDTHEAFSRIGEADSIVIDPHKHGLQPYGCGCVLFKDSSAGRIYKHDSPYCYFTSEELHLGEISLECSRPGASAVALWATQKMFPLVSGGDFAASLGICRSAALDLYGRLEDDPRFVTTFPPELDIVVWAIRSPTATESSRLARLVFDESAKSGLHIALATLPANLFAGRGAIQFDQPQITCLRSCLMKPEHKDWLDRIWRLLSAATDRATGARG